MDYTVHNWQQQGWKSCYVWSVPVVYMKTKLPSCCLTPRTSSSGWSSEVLTSDQLAPKRPAGNSVRCPGAAVLWLVNTGQQKPIDRQNGLLLKATGAWGSCHAGAVQMSPSATNKKMVVLSMMQWTLDQACDFHKIQQGKKKLLRVVDVYERNLQTFTSRLQLSEQRTREHTI